VTTATGGETGWAAPPSGGNSTRRRIDAAQECQFPSRDRYVDVVTGLHDGGFEMCADLCAVDYLTHPGRTLPDGVLSERFEVVVPATDAVLPTLFNLYPGTEAMEREAYDLLGVVFTGHPDMTRILLPEDWEGHPLRKDYGIGRVPVQFKGAPGPR
jgi:NADH-quinone oxidoreductase subunit C